MNKRLARIVTRKGDDGTTALTDGQRISKSSLHVAVIGELDELNSFIGLLVSEMENAETQKLLLPLQHELFNLGAELSSGNVKIDVHSVERLEAQIQEFDTDLPEVKKFILPGGSRAAALAHVCRAITRRVERALVQMKEEQGVTNPLIKQYINRLSDWFFMLARTLNHQANVQELFWDKDVSR